MRVRLLRELALRTGTQPAGAELDVSRVYGDRMVADGLAGEVLPNGKLRRRRGRPRRDEHPQPGAEDCRGSLPSAPGKARKGYLRGDATPEA